MYKGAKPKGWSPKKEQQDLWRRKRRAHFPEGSKIDPSRKKVFLIKKDP